jgi:putative methionine-R-sulfoxide reductase with GAF domain
MPRGVVISMMPKVHNSISALLQTSLTRHEKVQKVAQYIKEAGEYRWVGIYDVGAELVSLVAYSGPGAPAFPTFPKSEGLTGAAIRNRASVVVGDVRADPTYLTAFGSTLSEAIIPVLDLHTGTVLGTVDVESEKADAFSHEEVRMIEVCTAICLPLWEVR